MNKLFFALAFAALVGWPAHRSPTVASERIDTGLLVLYDFAEGAGATVHDCSGVGAPLDLVINKTKNVRWSQATLRVESSTLIASAQPHRK